MGKFSLASYDGYIQVKYTHQGERLKISTQVPSKGVFDPGEKALNKRHPNYQSAKLRTDNTMNLLITASTRVIATGFEPSVSLVRREYQNLLQSIHEEEREPEIPDFYERWHEFMKIKSVEMRYDGFRNYSQLYDLLREFEESEEYAMDFGTFDAVKFGRLKRFMFVKKDYADATTDKHVTKLRTFYKWAVPGMDRSFMRFTPKLPDNVHPLEPDEFRILIDKDLGSGFMDKARDLFVFCACTGMRYADSQRFQSEWIRNGIITYTQRKTAGEALVPLLDTARKILAKHDGTTPKMTNPAYNRHLKVVFQKLPLDRLVKVKQSNAGKMEEILVPFWKQASSHTARKTFITYALYKGVPIQDVMKMSGHSDYKAMKPYISISREHIREEGKKLGL